MHADLPRRGYKLLLHIHSHNNRQLDFSQLGNDIGEYPGHELKDRYHFQALQRKERPTKIDLRIESRQKRASAVH